MRLDFNISPILPACGNAPRRSNVEAGLGNESTQKKEGAREEGEEEKKSKTEKKRGSTRKGLCKFTQVLRGNGTS